MLFSNQQLPILPGRFQPSTFGVCELNYRVRHGYGCILTAIATESESLFSQNCTEEVPKSFSLAFVLVVLCEIS